MFCNENSFARRADRACNGTHAAKLALHREMEPALERIVRRVLEQGAVRSPLDKRILVEAKQIGLDAKKAASADGERLVRQVARRVCSLVLVGAGARPEPANPVEETIRN